MSRDFLGYGEKTPNPNWPNGAKLCISFVLNYEEGGENSVAHGDAASEVFLNETPGGQPRMGVRDMNMETQYEYGSRAGVWRILRMFDQRNLKFTCYAVGRAVEVNPLPVKAMKQSGHEIGSHNYRWIDFQYLSPEAELGHIRKCIEVIKNATGEAPTGWYTGRIGPNSRRLVVEEYKRQGLELLWESDAYNDDLPYWTKEFGEPSVLVIPYTLDSNDMKFCVPPGFSSPDGFEQYLKDAIDVLLEEGKQGSPKMLSVGLHCRLVGRPGRAAALARVLDYVKSLGSDVWVATRSEIALHWRKEFPQK